MIVPRSMIVVLDTDLAKHLGQLSIMAHPSTAFRLTVKTASNGGTKAEQELLCSSWSACRQALTQLQVGVLARALDM